MAFVQPSVESQNIIPGSFFGVARLEQLPHAIRSSHRYKHWRNAGWKRLPKRVLYREPGLVTLVGLIPSLASHASS